MKKKIVWIVLLIVVLLGSCIVLLDDNLFKTDIDDVMSEKEHNIQKQEKVEITLNIPKSKLPESIYSPEGQAFSENEIVVYKTDTTTIYLEKVMLSNDSNEHLNFIFNCSYDLPDSGIILTPYRKEEDDALRDYISLVNEELSDDTTTYQDISIIGHGPAEIFTISIPVDASKKAAGTMKIDVFINRLAYERM